MAKGRARQLIGLDDLGERIVILGPSNSGKSTLAAAIGSARGLTVIHLDQFRHVPGTDWVERSDDEFASLHAAAVAQDRWVMDGNYSRWLPQRLDRATGLIVLDAPALTSLGRYVRRALFERQRAGNLQGAPDRLNFRMLRHVLGPARRDRVLRYRKAASTATTPAVLLSSSSALREFYGSQHLSR